MMNYDFLEKLLEVKTDIYLINENEMINSLHQQQEAASPAKLFRLAHSGSFAACRRSILSLKR